MKKLSQYIAENICEEAVIQSMCLTYDGKEGTNAKTWFTENGLVDKDGKISLGKNDKNGFITLEQLEELYVYAQNNHMPCPLIVNYHHKPKKFVFRRWVGSGEPAEVILRDVKNIHQQSTPYCGLHNTNMKEDGAWFPSAEDMESVIAYAYNKVNQLIKDDSDNILYVTAKVNIPNSKAAQLTAYYAANKASLDKIVAAMPGHLGRLKKLQNPKKGISDEWKENGEYTKEPNPTPKTDVISEKGYRISFKKAGGSQLMSGYEHEARATLVCAAQELNDKEKLTIIAHLFEEPWVSGLSTVEDIERSKGAVQNRNLSEKIKKLFLDKKFKRAVMLEAASGRIKFKNEDCIANIVFVWDEYKADNNHWYPIEEYIDKHLDDAVVSVTYKTSSDKTGSVLRINTK